MVPNAVRPAVPEHPLPLKRARTEKTSAQKPSYVPKCGVWGVFIAPVVRLMSIDA
jgi:hypothetical protein